MITKIKVSHDRKNGDIILFDSMSPERINLLCGGNGVGKSTLINSIINFSEQNILYDQILSSDKSERIFKEMRRSPDAKVINEKYKNIDFRVDKPFDIISFVDGVDNIFHTKSVDLPMIIGAIDLSKGESNLYSFSKTFEELADVSDSSKYKVRGERDYVILIDGIDSGLSIDHVDQICVAINKIVHLRKDVQFFVAFNDFRFVYRFKRVVSMYNGEFYDMGTYSEYFDFIKNGEKYINSRRKVHASITNVDYSEFINPSKLVIDVTRKE